MRKKSVSFSNRNQRWVLHGEVQLEWYKRVVPAGLNKITCGGEQTNTLSSDNEHCTTTHPGLRIVGLVLSVS